MIIETEVTEAQVKAVVGAGWGPKLQMVAAADAIYTKRGGQWYRVPSPVGQRAAPSARRPLADPQSEREFHEHGRAVFEGRVE